MDIDWQIHLTHFTCSLTYIFFFKQRGEKILVLKKKFKPGHNSADSFSQLEAARDSRVQDESRVRAQTESSSTHGADQSAEMNSNHLSNASSISSVASTVSKLVNYIFTTLCWLTQCICQDQGLDWKSWRINGHLFAWYTLHVYAFEQKDRY